MGFRRHSRIGSLGTQMELPDGRYATTVFNGLCGVGVRFGLHDPDPKIFEGTFGDLFASECPTELEEWIPEAMLREKTYQKNSDLPCVCEETDVRIIRWGLDDYVNEEWE